MRVASDELTTIKGGVRQENEPSSGDNLLGFQIDLDYKLSESNILTASDVRKTGDVNCMFEAICRVASHVQTIRQIESELESVWLWTSYSHFEAYSLSIIGGKATLDFVTVMGVASLYVTGKIIVDLGRLGTLH